ncbi:MAG: flagellin [Desulfurococcales archaeon]|nr:flagellin [Desulfurococcales archaeon]
MRSRKGIVGIEAAIVMIAFVIVAAALAFVALNMGLTATQKTKEAVSSSLGEAGSALMVDGDVVANVTKTKTVDAIVIPIRPSSGKYPIDLDPDRAAISLLVSDNYYPDVYLSSFNYTSGNTTATFKAIETVNTTTSIDLTTYLSDVKAASAAKGGSPLAKVIIVSNDKDTVLEYGEKALVIVYLGNNAAGPYDYIKVEIKPPEGAPLVVERVVPPSLPAEGGLFSLG